MADSGVAAYTLDGSDVGDLSCVRCHELQENPMMLICGHRIGQKCFQAEVMGKTSADSICCPCLDDSCVASPIKEVRPDQWASKEIQKIRDGLLESKSLKKTSCTDSSPKDDGGAPRLRAKPGTKPPPDKETPVHKRPSLEELPDPVSSAVVHQQLMSFKADMKQIMEGLEGLARNLETLEKDGSELARRIHQQESMFARFATKTDVDNLNGAIKQLKKRQASLENPINEAPPGDNKKIRLTPSPPNNGIYIWKISDYSRLKSLAVEGAPLSLTSPPFYTAQHGYKLCARVYLNGDGKGCIGKYMSLYLVIMKGEYDALMSWPFKMKVSFTLKANNVNGDNSKDIAKIVSFNADLPSCMRPNEDLNPAFGLQSFVQIREAEDYKHYIVDDTLFIKISVE